MISHTTSFFCLGDRMSLPLLETVSQSRISHQCHSEPFGEAQDKLPRRISRLLSLANTRSFGYRLRMTLRHILSREKARMRGNQRASSPQSSPVKGEDVKNTSFRSYFIGIGLLVVSSLLFFNHAQAENIKIGLPSTTITAMPFFVARDHGFFQQEGLNAEIVVMPASLNVKVLLAGEIQYVATIGSAVAAAIRGIIVRTIMLFVDRPLQDLVGAPCINAIADVK